MLLKEHSQKPSWPSKRFQRCLSFALVFILIVVVGLTTHGSWPRKADISLSSYTYGSSPDAGRPVLPFADNSQRRSTEDPFFETDYEEYDEDDGDDEDPPTIQPRVLTGSEILTREELIARKDKLIDLR